MERIENQGWFAILWKKWAGLPQITEVMNGIHVTDIRRSSNLDLALETAAVSDSVVHRINRNLFEKDY